MNKVFIINTVSGPTPSDSESWGPVFKTRNLAQSYCDIRNALPHSDNHTVAEFNVLESIDDKVIEDYGSEQYP